MIKILRRRTRAQSFLGSFFRSEGNTGEQTHLQFVALDGLLLRRLLHKVRDEDFQCGSSWNHSGGLGGGKYN